MASNINLDSLLQAFHNAVLEAQLLTEQQHIEQLNRYFDWPDDESQLKTLANLEDNVIKSGGKAKVWRVEIPSISTDGSVKTETIEIPLLSLIPPTAIKIKNMVVEFEVGLSEASTASSKTVMTLKRPLPVSKLNAKALAAAAQKEQVPQIGIDLKGTTGKTSPMAKVRIEFEGTDPAESILRINDHLVKTIL